MISISSKMVLKSVLASMLLGAIFAICYTVLLTIGMLAKGLILRKKISENASCSKAKTLTNVIELLSTLTVGVSYLLLSYVLLDGVLEIYSLLSLIASFFLVRKALLAIKDILVKKPNKMFENAIYKT